MSRRVLLALLAAVAVAAPLASAHQVWSFPVTTQDGGVGCAVIWIGSPALPPHGVGSVLPCSAPSHSARQSLP